MANPYDDSDGLLSFFDFGQAHREFVNSIARGILIERYEISPELADQLLETRAAAAGIPTIEAAYRLVSTGVLPPQQHRDPDNSGRA